MTRGSRLVASGVLLVQQTMTTLATAEAAVRPVLTGAACGVVCVLDLNGMTAVNLRHGRVFGDRVMRSVEASLRRAMPDACVARLPGDQFIVVVPGRFAEAHVARRCEDAARTWLVSPRGRLVRTAARVGCATWHDAGTRQCVVRVAAARLDRRA